MMLQRRAFSLIEVLVVVAIVGVLVGLAAPALHHARQQARRAVSLSNMRSHIAVFSEYEQSNSEYYPYFTDPAGPIDLKYNGLEITCRYFDAHFRWSVALADGYYDGVAPHPSQLAPRTAHICSYFYSATFLADPEYWRLEQRTGPEQWRAVRAFEVVYPSEKALFTEVVQTIPWSRSTLVEYVGLGMVDGSANHWPRSQCTEPVLEGEGPWDGTALHHGVFGMHTVGGVTGRDVTR
ncbi:MAG: prepilin-type N-terminal cleavage/methylation domain-containing protein [Phycisphaerales bacterium]|nr:prepilin-type N-terminal cleavage/methylation domain-containing protein [Phycisphaerales bacterium]